MKTLKIFAVAVIVTMLGLGVTGCSGPGGYSDSKAKELIKKNGEGKLKKADYAEMLEWYEAINDEFMDEWVDILNDRLDYWDYQFATREMNVQYNKDYPYIMEVDDILGSASEDDMGTSTYNKYKKYQEKLSDKYEKYAKRIPKDKKSKTEVTDEIAAPAEEVEEYSEY